MVVGARVYPPLARQLAELLVRLEECDHQVERINERLPRKGERPRTAEQVARQLNGWISGGEEVSRLGRSVRLPVLEWSPLNRNTWPRAG
jgi:hypothetical protein